MENYNKTQSVCDLIELFDIALTSTNTSSGKLKRSAKKKHNKKLNKTLPFQKKYNFHIRSILNLEKL